MDSRTLERPSVDATEFVRFCYRRRRVGWPELYDEMCAVANRGLYRGWGSDELAEAGIGFSLFEMPALASLVGRIVAEEHERRAIARAELTEATRPARTDAARPAPADTATVSADSRRGMDEEGHKSTDRTSDPVPALHLAAATASA